MNTFSAIAQHIAERGWAVTDEFLPREAIEVLAQEARVLWTGGRFRKSGIGRGGGFQVRSDVRGDHILWLDRDSLTLTESVYWTEMERLRQALNEALFIGAHELEAHYAVYPPGAFYRKHLDRFSASDERLISCTLYLNPGWSEADGGALRLYTAEDGLQAHVDISPQAGVFVVFRSDTIYHEVLPALRERMSLTGWLRRRSSRF